MEADFDRAEQRAGQGKIMALQRVLIDRPRLGRLLAVPVDQRVVPERLPEDGMAAGTDANVKLYRVNFTFAEILPLYPAPV